MRYNRGKDKYPKISYKQKQKYKLMNISFPRFFKSAYRKEPISSFILTIGTVNAVMGGIGAKWTLLSFGIILVLMAILVRWLQIQQAESIQEKKSSRYLLPPTSSQAPLPILMSKKHRR